ncbi:hypothetical protein APHNP_0234 [Anaplasma phagocytophilum str. ApNP]|uniref:Uncharacterized protein n=2 Tax=Anaplasma phagocytophilum TaxID=948 RepID=A0A0F3NGB3_ANAPH|nr:hypothetical protein APHMUC_0460 [Anaplasma phagocytophilum str. ApMUC09]KJV66742.1 hypothetical protein APHNP_0234 [Anaplasma phagocytophilum str. ApNP]
MVNAIHDRAWLGVVRNYAYGHMRLQAVNLVYKATSFHV